MFNASSDANYPQLSPHFVFRWEASQNAHILLYPEGLIKLNASAGEILKRCDGHTHVESIIADLQRTFPGHDADIAASTRSFIEVAVTKGWLQSA